MSIDGTDSDTQRVLLGVVWRDHVPHLRTRRADHALSDLILIDGWRLNYRIEGEPSRTCVGHIPFRNKRSEYHDCKKAPRPGSRHCERCAIVEATFASQLHHAHHKGSSELDAAFHEHLAKPNRLYLAAFRDGSIKIGTSTLTRAETRLEEQGAWTARFIAETTNGRTVRHLEDAVTERLGIAQSVSAVRKRRGLVSPISNDQLSAMLQHAVDEVLRTIVNPAVGDDMTSLDLHWHHPMAEHPAAAHILDYPLALQKGRHDLYLVTAIGRHILVKRADGDDVFVIDPSPLFGVRLDIGEFGSDEITIQDSLF
ncbi:MAG: DUF2797 domain-containing protein [Acidimicrobiales bacterium]|jgi:hypothetical protein